MNPHPHRPGQTPCLCDRSGLFHFFICFYLAYVRALQVKLISHELCRSSTFYFQLSIPPGQLKRTTPSFPSAVCLRVNKQSTPSNARRQTYRRSFSVRFRLISGLTLGRVCGRTDTRGREQRVSLFCPSSPVGDTGLPFSFFTSLCPRHCRHHPPRPRRLHKGRRSTTPCHS